MSNVVIIGIIAIATIICCIIIAKITGNQRKVMIGGIFAVLSAGGFGYAIAYMVRKGLTGPYLTVAVLVGIIVPILIFLTVYNLVKEPSLSKAVVKEPTDEKELDEKMQAMEENKVYMKKVYKEIELSKQQIEQDQIDLARDKAALEKIAREVQKQKELIEQEKKKIGRQREEEDQEPGVKTVSFANYSQETVRLKQEFDDEKELLLKQFDEEKQNMLLDFEEERKLQRKSVEEEKTKLRQAFAKEKQQLEEEKLKVRQESITETQKDTSEELKRKFEKEIGSLEEEKAYLGQLVKEANVQQRQMEEDLRSLRSELEEERGRSEAAAEKIQKIEDAQRQKEMEAEARRKEAAEINSRKSKTLDFDNVMQKALSLQKKGLYQLAIALYKEYEEKVVDEAQKQLVVKAMADCYIDAGEPAKAKRLLAKR